VAAIRADEIHKATSALATSHEVVAVEQLSAKNMARHGGRRKRGLNRALDTKGAKDIRLLLQDDRNLVLYGFDGPAWASNTQTDEQPPAPAAEAPTPEVVPAAAEEPAPAPEPEPAPAPPPPPPAPRTYTVVSGRHPVGDRGTLLR
jgi:outer membrane biosynthesis protein TonB